MDNLKNVINLKFLKSLVFGLVIGGLVTVLFMLITSFIFLFGGKLPYEILGYLIPGFLGLGGFAGGFVSARIHGKAGLITGAAAGFTIFLAAALAGAGNFGSGATIYTLVKLLSAVVPAAIGGVIGVNKKDKIIV